MRFASLSLAAAALAGLMSACKGGSSSSNKTKDGYAYTLVGHKDDARKAKPGDFLTMHATYRTGKDSLLGTSHQQGMPYTIKIDTAAPPNGQKDPFLSCYLELSKGDSAVFTIPTDSLFKGAAAAQRPPFLKSGTNITLGVHVARLESQEEQDARIKKELEGYAGTGNFQKIGGDIYVDIKQKGTGPLAVKGDTLTVHYTGILADTMISKKPFDSSINPPQPGRTPEPLKFVIKTASVIPAWDSAFSVIPEGSKARILVPHQMAYGQMGAPGAIPPYSNLIFDVELLKITKPSAADMKKGADMAKAQEAMKAGHPKM